MNYCKDMPMPKTKFTNDQEKIIEAIDAKNYKYVWEQVKFIGYSKVRDINVRYMLFFEIVQKFITEKNNNFIYYYKKQLGYDLMKENETYFVTRTRGVINNWKNELVCPTDDHGGSKMVAEFYDNWCN